MKTHSTFLKAWPTRNLVCLVGYVVASTDVTVHSGCSPKYWRINTKTTSRRFLESIPRWTMIRKRLPLWWRPKWSDSLPFTLEIVTSKPYWRQHCTRRPIHPMTIVLIIDNSCSTPSGRGNSSRLTSLLTNRVRTSKMRIRSNMKSCFRKDFRFKVL